ncbi:DUF2651 family protein [Neobacillus massiliamazoniensis]|uniref:DUF2651 domain-containing protein n=1 Tax=Neobacillus massiliamazoniensis TaxID=1499688 RepID=A0A0U1NYI2_9BACI|nr:DUF2651 family protein [Neobacillus massiliamazoniensis]CRK83043.1 hypothetical protein BN000_02999 [Neobacillus massiliamazoniensis]
MDLISLILFIFPIAVIVASIIGFLVVRKWFVMPLFTFIVFAILMFSVFNETFFIWVVIYTILSIAVSFAMKFIKMLS